jgi:L-lactate dehydrogenase complex protein LldG
LQQIRNLFMTESSLVQTFKTRFEAVRGQVHYAETIADALTVLDGIFREYQPTRIALAQLPPALSDAIAAQAAAVEIAVLREPYCFEDLPDLIDTADIGIAGADFGIAESGTLAEVALNDATRLVSSLPRVYVGIVRASDLKPTLADAAPIMRKIFRQHDKNCVVSFLSGPSRTGDIEMRLTLGVHGPEIAHALILGEDAA